MFPFWKRLFMLLPRSYWEDIMPYVTYTCAAAYIHMY